MKKSAAIFCACFVQLGHSPAWATGLSVTDAPAAGHPKAVSNVSGSGFGANEAIDIYFDTTDMLLDVTNSSGGFGPDSLKIPADAAPGSHWITAIGRRDGTAAHALFTVRTLWSSYGYNERGRRRNPYENIIDASNVSSLDLAWAQTGGGAFSTPAYGGLIYAGSADGNLYAYSTLGTLKWKTAIASAILTSSPAFSGSSVIVGSSDGNLYAFNSANGALKWTSSPGAQGPIYSSPVVAAGIVYAGSHDGSLYAFNANTGVRLWAAATGGAIDGSPAVVNGVAYAGSADGKVYAFDSVTGSPVWASSIVSPGFSSPAVANGTVYIGGYDKNLHALSATTGAVQWMASAGGAIMTSPAVANGIAYFGSDDTKLYAVSTDTGTVLWTAWTGGTLNVSSPIIANGLVYTGASDGRLYAFSATGKGTMTPLWSASTGSIDGIYPIVADGYLFAGGRDGRLYAFSPDAGDKIRSRMQERPPSYASLHPDIRLRPLDHRAMRAGQRARATSTMNRPIARLQ